MQQLVGIFSWYLLGFFLSFASLSPACQAKHFFHLNNYDFAEETAYPGVNPGIFTTDDAIENRVQEEMIPSALEDVEDADVESEQEGNRQLGMMDTFEKFKRQAEKVSVPGDESGLTEHASSQSGLVGGLNWQTATIMSVFCVAAAIVGVVLGVVYWPKSAFGELSDAESGKDKAAKGEIGTGGVEDSMDRSLAQSAQMYHYQQQKQQMLAMDQATGKIHTPESEPESEGECDEPDENVYECPGLATAGELEVKNPLFQDDLGNESGTSTSSLKK